ncbi:MAG: hypothetical protein NTY38_27455, partial [Acidobacteria bacterium]|nr:hypothetical protein [Acidobacteriota bacterium]
EAEARNKQLEAQAASAEAERTRLTGSLAELNATLTSSNRTVEALQDQIRQRDQRLTPLEAENRALEADEQAVRLRLAGLSKQATDLAGIRRRREALINTLVRHYRELSDQYRALAMRFDSAGDRAGPNPGDISRIQAALSQADEDLRQLGTLNHRSPHKRKLEIFRWVGGACLSLPQVNCLSPAFGSLYSRVAKKVAALSSRWRVSVGDVARPNRLTERRQGWRRRLKSGHGEAPQGQAKA